MRLETFCDAIGIALTPFQIRILSRREEQESAFDGASADAWITGANENPSNNHAKITHPNITPVLGRPTTRGECAGVARPCPWEACRYHLEGGGESCALDVADRGEHTMEEVAEYTGVTRQAVEVMLSKRKVREAFKKLRVLV